MIIGFLGKGGSGKSTLATLMARHLHAKGATTLAIDADHNMDFSYNLGFKGNGPYIGGTSPLLRKKLGLPWDARTDLVFAETIPQIRFSLDPKDAYTEKYAVQLEPKLDLMVSGPQNENVIFGVHCSHSLASALAIYLPLLDLKENQYAVVDEKASVDAVTTGIPTGFDLAVIVVEPREHSLKVGCQIAEMLDLYEVPHIAVLNKSDGSDASKTLFKEAFGTDPEIVISTQENSTSHNPVIALMMEKILEKAKIASIPNHSRIARSERKSRRNKAHLKERS